MSRDVLSLLAFAKRPLRMSEVKEAMTILRSPGVRLTEDDIVRSCLGLVRYTPGPATKEQKKSSTDGIIRLSHSSVQKFLLEDVGHTLADNTDTKSGGEDDDDMTIKRRTFLEPHRPFVTEDIIRTSCLAYLAQPKYLKPLLLPAANPKSPSERANSNMLGSRTPAVVLPKDSGFLLYSAKYWFQHCDTTCADDDTDNSEHCGDPPEEVRQSVKNFISSPHFYTCMQVQSLFVQGHFLHSFDSITGRGQSVRRTLPNWMRRLEPELLRQYNTFQGEWCRLLKGRSSDPVRGDLSRCFWGSLGANNFLSVFDGGGRSRYLNFCFDSPAWRRLEDLARVWQIHHASVSPEGKLLLSTATVQTRDE